MAITNQGTLPNEPTGAVTLSGEPAEHTQVADPASTGAVDGPPAAVTVTFGPTGQEPTGAVDGPPVAVTTTHTSIKVIRPPARSDADASSTAETPESQAAAESRRAARAAERAAQPSDADGR